MFKDLRTDERSNKDKTELPICFQANDRIVEQMSV